MIDYELKNGDLVRKGLGDIKVIKSIESKKQSIAIRLNVERGSFIYDETLGSRLKSLLREKPSNINSLADAYVREALEAEEDIIVDKVEVKWLDKKKILILVFFIWNEISDRVEVIV